MSDLMQQLSYPAYEMDTGMNADSGCGCHASERQEEYTVRTYKGGCGECGCQADRAMQVCGFGVENGILAAVYAPLHRFDGVYDPDTAMRRGTMFEGLDKPFYGDGKGVDCRGNEK